MIKFLQKSLTVLAIVGAGLSANAQSLLFSENFQSFTPQGYPAGTICSLNVATNQYNTLEPAEGTFSVEKTYGDLKITYTFLNAAANDTCPMRGGTSITAVRVGSKGFAELTRIQENEISKVPGSLTLSKIPNMVTTLTANVSYTGGDRNCALVKSVDDGVTWDTVTTTAFFGGNYGVSGTVEINASNVMLRFLSLPTYITTPSSLASQRTKIHDIIVNTVEPTSLTNNLTLASGAKLSVTPNTVTVFSPESARLEIHTINGVIVTSQNIAPGTEGVAVIPQSGLYLVRYITPSRVITKKVFVE